MVAGEAPGEDLADSAAGWEEPARLLPVARELWADRKALTLQSDARAQWQADKRARRATKADEPSELHTPWFEAALAEWDAWHARACATVDAAVASHSVEPLPEGWAVVEELDAFAGVKDERDEDGQVPDWNDRCWREEEDEPPIEYKSVEMARFTRRRGDAEKWQVVRAEAQRRGDVALVAGARFGSDAAFGTVSE